MQLLDPFTPPEVRCLIENFLAAYTDAVDAQDAQAAATLLSAAALHFKGDPPLHGEEDIGAFYASAFLDPSRTHHLITNLRTSLVGVDAEYTAIYQRWSVADPTNPVCEAIGRYAGRFTLTAAGPTWVEHRVITT
ncbi:nuclear transport factor 2 family protein [Paenarthrobacter sp. A20]|uniref:nuclear transport factor 2 family protein n=1 Tax=Paenarthrobacter sp. A20 TaxID=2817891 RepID=UPI00209D151D|nr:nuclear transport factor 2 family protein [Paenarthrobacter sp. A20]MCP1415582.1 hypothetical protein [Paenarthrobacter sp. A20]